MADNDNRSWWDRVGVRAACVVLLVACTVETMVMLGLYREMTESRDNLGVAAALLVRGNNLLQHCIAQLYHESGGI